MLDSVFKDYGIVGKVGSEFVKEEVYKLGRAIAYYFVKYSDYPGFAPVQTIVIARNNLINFEFIEQELAQAFVDSGLNVIFLGICPIPVMFFSLHTLPVQAGIMISDYNLGINFAGIKIFYTKEQINSHQIDIIKELYKSKKWSRTNSIGNCKEYPKVQRYTEWLVNQFPELKEFDQSFVVDLAFSSASVVLPQLAEKLNFKNAKFINQQICKNASQPVIDSSLISVTLKSAIKLNNAQIGAFFSSDCDKFFVMLQSSKIISANKLSFLFMQDIKNEHPKIKNVNECFSFSKSGQYNFSDRYFGYDDGIYAMLRLFSLLKKNGKTIDQMLVDYIKVNRTSEVKIGYAIDLNANLPKNSEIIGDREISKLGETVPKKISTIKTPQKEILYDKNSN